MKENVSGYSRNPCSLNRERDTAFAAKLLRLPTGFFSAEKSEEWMARSPVWPDDVIASETASRHQPMNWRDSIWVQDSVTRRRSRSGQRRVSFPIQRTRVTRVTRDVFMWARGFECARALSSAYIVLCGAWCLDPRTHVLSFSSCRGSDTRAPFSVIVWVRGLGFARHCTLLSTCVLLCCTQFVFLSAACIYVISCAVWHAACIFIGCLLSCCHVLCVHVAYEFSH